MAESNLGSLAVYLTANLSGFKDGMAQAEKDIGKLATSIGVFSIASTAAMTAFATASVKSFIDANETTSKFDTVFKNVASSATASIIDLSDNFGLAGSSARKLMGNTGDLLTGFGFSQQEALKLSTEVNKLAVDLASFTNIEGGAQRASDALTRALLGERESAKSLGIAILEKDVLERVAILASKGMTFATERQAKAFATLQIAQEQSKNAIGDYARTADQGANQLRLFDEKIKELKGSIGKMIYEALNLSGAFKSTNESVSKLTAYIGSFDSATKNAIVRIAALAVGIATLAAAWKALAYTGIIPGIIALVKYIFIAATCITSTQAATLSIVQQEKAQWLLIASQDAAATSAARMSSLSLWTQMKTLPALTFASSSAMAAFGSAVAVVGVAFIGWELGKQISELTGLDKVLEDFYAKWIFGADELDKKNKEIDAKRKALNESAPKKAVEAALVAIDPEILKAQKDLNEFISESSVRNLEGQAKINYLEQKRNELLLQYKNTLVDVDALKRIELEKKDIGLQVEIENIKKGIDDKIKSAQTTYDDKMRDIAFKNLDSEGKINLLIKERAELQERIANSTDREEQLKLATLDAEKEQQIKELGGNSSTGTQKESDFAGAVSRGTAEAYRMELAKSSKQDDMQKRTEDNTKQTAQNTASLLNVMGTFVSELGVA